MSNVIHCDNDKCGFIGPSDGQGTAPDRWWIVTVNTEKGNQYHFHDLVCLHKWSLAELRKVFPMFTVEP